VVDVGSQEGVFVLCVQARLIPVDAPQVSDLRRHQLSFVYHWLVSLQEASVVGGGVDARVQINLQRGDACLGHVVSVFERQMHATLLFDYLFLHFHHFLEVLVIEFVFKDFKDILQAVQEVEVGAVVL